MRLNRNLRLFRVNEELTQEQLSKKANVSRSIIVRIEKGEIDTVKLGTLKKIAAALNSTVEELFFRGE